VFTDAICAGNGQLPDGRAVHPPEAGKVIALPHLGGLHHQYVRFAA